MAGPSLDENRMNVGVSTAQLPLPQGQLGPKLCLRKNSQNTAARVPSITKNTDRLSVPSKKDISHPEGMPGHFYTGRSGTQFYLVVIYSFSSLCRPPPHPKPQLLLSHISSALCSISHLSLLPC